ncbi:zinc finger MYM-type protein 1-like, partial [Parasteatoda tepidariorum]|uniref:zinc finger MYM-type protein 1-like n=1 Tax=Parasteatoda tepidariorum TaxID=114398 RepID=UPI001C725BBB
MTVLKREWLVYSPAKNAVFCYICKLFSASDQSLCKGGFSYWKNTSERLKEHENSMVHRNSVLALSQRLTSSMRIDSKLVEEYANERLYWRKVLARVVATTQFLCQRELAFFGSDETIGSFHNGNFLGILELLGKFDPFLAEHLAKYGNPGTGNVNYLSSTVVTELISIMSQKVLDRIVAEVQTSKYFGLIVDSTPDITHNDQLSIVLRYVDKSGRPLESITRWSAAAEDTKSLQDGYKDIMQALCEISSSSSETSSTRCDAKSLYKKMDKRQTAVLAVSWDTILQRLNKVNIQLQATDGN